MIKNQSVNYFSSLKINISKCEVAGIGSLQRVKMAVCGIKCTDFTTNYENLRCTFFL